MASISILAPMGNAETWTAERAVATPKIANISAEISSSQRNDASGTPLADGRFF